MCRCDISFRFEVDDLIEDLRERSDYITVDSIDKGVLLVRLEGLRALRQDHLAELVDRDCYLLSDILVLLAQYSHQKGDFLETLKVLLVDRERLHELALNRLEIFDKVEFESFEHLCE